MKHLTRIFFWLFLGLCALPLAALLVLGPAEAASNQVLASAPSLTNRDGSFNDGVLTDLSDYLSDRFGFRQELITLQARLTAALFHESAADSVLLGSEGWLYYADTLPDYEGTNALTHRQPWAGARTLRLIQGAARAQGAQFLFTVAPNKNSLYPDAMPDRYPRSDTPGNWQRLRVQLEALGVAYVDLTETLTREEPVYYRTDSHWNDYGAALAHDAILEALGETGAAAQEPFTTGTHLGDLYAMLYPTGTETETCPVLDRDRTFTYTAPFRSPEDMTIRTESAGALGSLLMYRDSFGNNLYAPLAESFSKACFSRSMPLQLELMEETQPDLVLFELVERNLSWLCTQPPVLAALPCEPVEAETTGASVALTIREANGLTCYSGSLEALDWDSPVYLSLDGTCYEATPAGTGDNPFTLYGPKADVVRVYYRSGGRWLEAET